MSVLLLISTLASPPFPHKTLATTTRLVSLSWYGTNQKRTTIKCSAAANNTNNNNKSSSSPSSSSYSVNSTAKIRSEVLTPFRSLRMFFYLAFIASGSLGGLIATTRLISSLSVPSLDIIDIVQGLAIDLAAVSLFTYLYYTENKAKNAQIAKLSREENLSRLKLRVSQSKVVDLGSLRGIARLIIVVGPADFVKESFKLCQPYIDELLDRAVLVVPFATDGDLPQFEFGQDADKRKRLWQLLPVNTGEWSRWLDEQKKMANVSPESPVYISLRMDGRVRGSGVGYPPWNAFVAQLPPVKGLWSGLLDGMDGRVL